MKVSNMLGKNGSRIKNQFIILGDDNSVSFQSYNTVIARKYPGGRIVLDSQWDNSVTTAKYRNIFLMESTAETKDKVKSGKYEIADLNNRADPDTLYYVFVRDWYKENPEYPNGLEPCAGKEEIIAQDISEDEARKIAREYNRTHNPGRLSRKAEFSEI
jgi:hypothetical protein